MLTGLGSSRDTPESFPDTECGKFYDHAFSRVFASTVPRRPKSWTQSAEESLPNQDVDKNASRRYKMRYLEGTEATYASSRLLATSYVVQQDRLFESEEEEGLMLLFDSQGDEASRQLRVRDESAMTPEDFLAIQDDDAHDEISSTTKRKAHEEIPSILISAKVQYSEFGVTFVTRRRSTGEVMCTHFDLPCPLQAFDRGTGETLVTAQESLLDLTNVSASFMKRFKHVGWAPCQDGCGANERQVNALLLADQKRDEYGGKVRFRIPTLCDVHKWARMMTSTHSFCQSIVSGLIAWAIEERQPNRLRELREITGKRLRAIAVIIRNTIPSDYPFLDLDPG
jgi:hypothetical protein